MVSTEKGTQCVFFTLDRKNIQVDDRVFDLFSLKLGCISISLEGRAFGICDLKSDVSEIEFDSLDKDNTIIQKFTKIVTNFGNLVSQKASNLDFIEGLSRYITTQPNPTGSRSKIRIDEARRKLFALTRFSYQNQYSGTSEVAEQSVIKVYDISDTREGKQTIRHLFDILDSDLKSYVLEKHRINPEIAGKGWTIIEAAPTTIKDHPEVHLVVIFDNSCRVFLSLDNLNSRIINRFDPDMNSEYKTSWRLFDEKLPLKLLYLQEPTTAIHKPKVIHQEPVT